MIYHQIHPADVASQVTQAIHHDSMRLSRQQIAVIENYVVYLHDCFFNENSIDANIKSIYGHLQFHEKLKVLHAIASSFATSMGAVDQEIRDHVLIRSIYCAYDRSLGKTTVTRTNDGARTAPVLALEQLQETA